MTVVNVNFASPAQGGRAPARGSLTWQRLQRLVDGPVVLLPGTASADVVAGVATIDPDPGFYVFFEGVPGGERRVLSVPALGPVNYADLVEVDPATLEPSADLLPAWQAAQRIVVGPDNTLTEPGLWVQTGLGPDGDDFTFWIEDGQ